MNALVKFLNWLTDMDWGWWPLLSMRPPRDKPINSAILLKITPCFGTIVGLAVAAIKHHLRSPARIAVDVLIAWLAFFVLYRFTFAVAWNSRARILSCDMAERRGSPGDGPAASVGDSGAAGGTPSVSRS